MPINSSTYKELLLEIKKLQSENKRLRLRPSIHSTDANILEFLNIKSQMAEAVLYAKDIDDAIEICTLHLSRISNIHSVSFFRSNSADGKLKLISEKGLPKKFISKLKETPFIDLQSFLFPQENIRFQAIDEKTNESEFSFISKYLKKYQTIIVMPIMRNTEIAYSVLLLSTKEFHHDSFFKVLNQSIMAQLKSSFSRIQSNEQLKIQAIDLEQKIKQRTWDYENMNMELLKQIKTHKQKEQKNAEELELYKSIITQQKDVVIRINIEGQILFFNPSFSRVKQLHKGDRESIFSYFGEGDFPGLAVIINDFNSGIQRVNCEIQLNTESLEWFNFYFSPIKNSRDLITEIQIVARNINEIKRIQKELWLQKDMLVNMLNTSEKVSFTINKMGIVEQLSDNWEKYTGNPVQTALHHHLVDFAHKDDVKKIIPKIQKLLNKKIKSCQFNFRLKYTDNSWNWQTTEMNTVLDHQGDVLYFVGCFHPINFQ